MYILIPHACYTAVVHYDRYIFVHRIINYIRWVCFFGHNIEYVVLFQVCINEMKDIPCLLCFTYTIYYFCVENCHSCHRPINHWLTTPFLSYKVTLNARKTRDFIRDLIIRQYILARFNCAIFNSHITWRKNFVMFVLPLVRHVFFSG